MGFSLWHGDGTRGYRWVATQTGGSVAPLRFGPSPGVDGDNTAKKLGLMFQGTAGGLAPWDMSHNASSIRDGLGTTILLAENAVGGATGGNASTGNRPTGWAAGLPRFVGFVASAEICESGDCATTTDLAPGRDGIDGRGWARANRKGSFESINYGSWNGLEDGTHPFANSLHPGGFVVGMCDGSTRFVTETIDGTVYAKLITPDGETLPNPFRQLPLNADQIPGD